MTLLPIQGNAQDSLAPTHLQRLIIEFSRRFGLGNGALRKHGARLVYHLRSEPIHYDYHGLTLRFDPDLVASGRHMLMSPQWSEQPEREFILQHLPANGTFLDIGMNSGFYTFFVAATRPGCKVLSFEPNSKLVARARANAAANGLRQVHIEEVALWDSDDDVTVEGVRVRGAMLTSMLDKYSVEAIDVMKIDVDGPEDRILMPFFAAKPRSVWPKAIIIEHVFIEQQPDNCLRFAKENGYREVWRSTLNTALVLE